MLAVSLGETFPNQPGRTQHKPLSKGRRGAFGNANVHMDRGGLIIDDLLCIAH